MTAPLRRQDAAAVAGIAGEEISGVGRGVGLSVDHVHRSVRFRFMRYQASVARRHCHAKRPEGAVSGPC